MLDTKVFMKAIEDLEKIGIAHDVTIQAIKEAFESIFKKKGYEDTRVEVDIDEVKGTIDIYSVKTVVENVEDDNLEVEYDEIKDEYPDIKVGDDLKVKHEIENFSKADIVRFQSVLKQKIKEAEKTAIYNAFSDKTGELITGVVEKIEDRYTIVSIGGTGKNTSVSLPNSQKIGQEEFKLGQQIKVYLSEVNSATSGPQLRISRSEPGFLKRLFEEEIPEVFNGQVVIKDIAREAGERSKVSVYSTDETLDPIGACIGQGGSKIQKICSQINHEKIDIVLYHEYAGLFIAEALKPAEVLAVKLNEEEKSAVAIVKNGDLRVAIGKRGINVVLAVKLTGWKIDIKEQDVALAEGIVGEDLNEMTIKEHEMILIKQREEIFKEIASSKEDLVEEETLDNEVVTPTEEEVAPVTKEDIKVEEEKVDVNEIILPTKEEIEKETKVVEEEPTVVYNPVKMQPTTSLSDLEKQIEEEKKRKSSSQNAPIKKKYKKDEEEEVKPQPKKTKPQEEKKKPDSYMSIYTDEELEEFDAEDEEEENRYDDDIDSYDEYDKYYEDN